MTSEKESSKVLIAIQARSNSTRLPGKIFLKIGNKSVLQHVIDQAISAKNYITRSTHKVKIDCDIAVLHPENDKKIIDNFKKSGALLIAGSEQDVLSRFITAMKVTNSDYIVRITSDCPLILDFVISKHINVAIFNKLDYVSNVDESCRFAFDGLDCEILSKKAIEWLSKNAISDYDKEHVTTLIRSQRPKELEQGFITFKLDNSSMKLSLDTEEDLDRIREYYHKREEKMNKAIETFGKKYIYEL